MSGGKGKTTHKIPTRKRIVKRKSTTKFPSPKVKRGRRLTAKSKPKPAVSPTPSASDSDAEELELDDGICEEVKRGRRLNAKSKPKPAVSPTPSVSDSDAEESELDDGICEECGGCYQDDDTDSRQSWMGCDTCDRWFHYGCIGLRAIPKGFWSCEYCSH